MCLVMMPLITVSSETEVCVILNMTPSYSGMYLRQCGAAEVKLGQALVLYHSRVQKEYLTPLRAFLEVDIKNIMVRIGLPVPPSCLRQICHLSIVPEFTQCCTELLFF